MSWQPKYTITKEVLSNLTRIERVKEAFESKPLSPVLPLPPYGHYITIEDKYKEKTNILSLTFYLFLGMLNSLFQGRLDAGNFNPISQ